MQNHAFVATTTCNERVTFYRYLLRFTLFVNLRLKKNKKKSWLTKVLYFTVHRAKKVVSDSPGLVDFAIGLVNCVLNLPEEQVDVFQRIKITEVLQDKNFKFLINLFGPKVAPTKWNLLKQGQVSHYMSDETYWDPVHKINKQILKKTLEVNVAVTNSY